MPVSWLFPGEQILNVDWDLLQICNSLCNTASHPAPSYGHDVTDTLYILSILLLLFKR